MKNTLSLACLVLLSAAALPDDCIDKKIGIHQDVAVNPLHVLTKLKVKHSKYREASQ